MPHLHLAKGLETYLNLLLTGLNCGVTHGFFQKEISSSTNCSHLLLNWLKSKTTRCQLIATKKLEIVYRIQRKEIVQFVNSIFSNGCGTRRKYLHGQSCRTLRDELMTSWNKSSKLFVCFCTRFVNQHFPFLWLVWISNLAVVWPQLLWSIFKLITVPAFFVCYLA